MSRKQTVTAKAFAQQLLKMIAEGKIDTNANLIVRVPIDKTGKHKETVLHHVSQISVTPDFIAIDTL